MLNKITQGDCLDLLKLIPDNSIDVTFADPPFNLKKKYNSNKDNLTNRDYSIWCSGWLHQMIRVTKPTGSIFVHHIPRWLTRLSLYMNISSDFKHWISWDALGTPMGNSLQPAHYGILYYAKDKKLNTFYKIRHPHKRCRKCGYLLRDYGGKKKSLHPFGPVASDVWTDIFRVKHKALRDKHPCQLPIHLLERIILMSSDEHDVILDPFSGTGSTAVAAKKLGRQYIGFELDKEYTDISIEKLSNTKADSKVGNSWVSIHRDQIVTVRDKDWNDIATQCTIPDDLKEIDHTKVCYGNK